MTKILLVEDNEMNQDMLSRRLKRRGYELVFAMDGAAGVERALVEQPDLILMDMSLPVMDGWNATRRIKQDARTTHIPIIALTAHAMVGDREKTIAAGCDDYDTKPVELARLLEKIEALLSKPKAIRTAVVSEAANLPTPQLSELSPDPTTAAMPQSSPPAPNTYRILVVDDNEMNRDVLSRRLEKAGYEVLLAENGAIGLEMVQQQPIHLVILDIMMPGMNGLEVLRTLRTTYCTNQLPVIMASAKDQSEDVVNAFDLGANDYVTKPINMPILLARLQSHLRIFQSQRLTLPGSGSTLKDTRETIIAEASSVLRE